MSSHQFKIPEEACKLLHDIGKKSRYAIFSDRNMLPCVVDRFGRSKYCMWVLYIGNDCFYSDEIATAKYDNNRFRFKLENGLEIVVKVIDTKPVDISQMM